MRRACAILICQVLVVAFSVLYVSVKSVVVCYAFSIAAAMLVSTTGVGLLATGICLEVAWRSWQPHAPALKGAGHRGGGWNMLI